MFAFIKRLFGAVKQTAEAVAEPEVAKSVILQPDAVEKKPAARKRAGRPRKTSKQ